MIADRWGVTDAELARHYACDDLVRDPVLAAWRGVTVRASLPSGDDTRLLLKVVTSSGRLTAPLLSVGDLVMARRQLLNFKRLAEGSG